MGATIFSPFYILASLFLLTTIVTGQTASSTTAAPSTSTELSSISSPTPTSTHISLTPAMSSASVAGFFSALASASPQQPGNGVAPGEGNPSDTGGDSDAGASGSDTESINLSTGVIVAIVVIVAGVIIITITTATLWYFAKKRSWEVRASIRRSAKRVATALTPKRSTFPKDVRRSRRFSKGLQRIDEVPNTPWTRSRDPRSNDVEKGNVRMSAFEFTEPEVPGAKRGWGSKFGR